MSLRASICHHITTVLLWEYIIKIMLVAGFLVVAMKQYMRSKTQEDEDRRWRKIKMKKREAIMARTLMETKVN